MRSIGSLISPTILSDRVFNSLVASENTPALTNKQNLEVKNRPKKRKTSSKICCNPIRRKLCTDTLRLHVTASAARPKSSKKSSISHTSKHGRRPPNSDDSYDPEEDTLSNRNISCRRARRKWIQKRKKAGSAAKVLQVAVKRKRRNKGDIDRSGEIQRKTSRRKAGEIDRSGEIQRKT